MAYALGHSNEELRRLGIQSTILAPFTSRLIADAGVQAGMSVLDIGCGTGDASFMLADAVGTTGRVLGVDRESAAIDTARHNASVAGYHSVTFAIGDEIGLAGGERFDVVFARYLLIHQADPATFLQSVANLLRPGGIVVCEEAGYHLGTRCWPDVPLWNAMFDSIATFTRLAFPNYDAAGRLLPLITAAGLIPLGARATSIVGSARSAYLSYGVASYRAFLPAIEKLNLVHEEVGDPDTIEDRIGEAIHAADAQFVGCPEFGAWGRLDIA